MSIKKIYKNQPELFRFSDENLKKAQEEIKKYPKERKASAVLALLYLAQNQKFILAANTFPFLVKRAQS